MPDWKDARRSVSRGLLNACVHNLMMMLYFVGMFLSEAGTFGASVSCSRLCMDSASLNRRSKQSISSHSSGPLSNSLFVIGNKFPPFVLLCFLGLRRRLVRSLQRNTAFISYLLAILPQQPCLQIRYSSIQSFELLGKECIRAGVFAWLLVE